jgi:hypothetical protein
MRVKIFSVPLLLICCAVNLAAQDKPELIASIERIFRGQEPRWNVERITVGSTLDPYSETIVLRAGKLQAAVDISIWRRLQDAQDVFAGQTIAFDNTGGAKKIKSRIPNLGDENHLWTNRRSTAWPLIKFRKGNVNVEVFAPTLLTAKRFAQRVLKQIAAG